MPPQCSSQISSLLAFRLLLFFPHPSNHPRATIMAVGPLPLATMHNAKLIWSMMAQETKSKQDQRLKRCTDTNEVAIPKPKYQSAWALALVVSPPKIVRSSTLSLCVHQPAAIVKGVHTLVECSTCSPMESLARSWVLLPLHPTLCFVPLASASRLVFVVSYLSRKWATCCSIKLRLSRSWKIMEDMVLTVNRFSNPNKCWALPKK